MICNVTSDDHRARFGVVAQFSDYVLVTQSYQKLHFTAAVLNVRAFPGVECLDL
jgi:hypothetical protein